MSVFVSGIPFCLEWNLIPGTTKAGFGIWVGKSPDTKFELKKNTLVGKALYRDGFPLKYEVHPSLKLDDRQKLACEKIIHRAIAGMLPLLFMEMGIETVQFTPTFPPYVIEEGPIFDPDCII